MKGKSREAERKEDEDNHPDWHLSSFPVLRPILQFHTFLRMTLPSPPLYDCCANTVLIAPRQSCCNHSSSSLTVLLSPRLTSNYLLSISTWITPAFQVKCVQNLAPYLLPPTTYTSLHLFLFMYSPCSYCGWNLLAVPNSQFLLLPCDAPSQSAPSSLTLPPKCGSDLFSAFQRHC